MKYIIILMILMIPLLSADIISVNSGGSNEIVVNSDQYIEGFFSGEVLDIVSPVISGISTVVSSSTARINWTTNELSNSTVYYGKTTATTSVLYSATSTITHSIFTTGLSASTKYYYNVSSCDDSANCGTSSQYTFTTLASVIGGPGGGGAGGGGGAAIAKFEDLKAVPSSFNIPITVGIIGSGKITLSNKGNFDLEIEIDLANLDGIVEFSKEKFKLGYGQSEIFEFKIIPPRTPGVYSGKIIFRTKNGQLEIPFALNVNSALSLFDISVDISDESKFIEIGEKLKSQITLIQAGLQKEMDVTMIYEIKDFNGNVYSRETETLMVFKEKFYEKEFPTQNLPEGVYLISTEVIYEAGVATASYQFEITALKKETKQSYVLIIIELILAIGVLIALIVLVKKYKRRK